ncbi:hypothetical protein KJF94_18345 [Pseudomonas hormoni]|uniref:Uncharacterized protein n=1 Tax=Pseudomonas hormoni TaxID=3093767 RepID=A0ABX8ET05_9PSED|nr:hypothetical protein [Pseudomonas hormoni]QVW21847.1 hypothetical protein KJF94_18345 [Pseudomonas hormoni]
MDKETKNKGENIVDPSQNITYESAKLLVKSGEWVFQTRLFEDIRELVKKRVEINYGTIPDLKRVDYASRMLVSVIEKIAEDEKIYDMPNVHNPLDPKLTMRVGFGRILKITPTLKDINCQILGLVGTVLAVSDWNKMAVIATAFSVTPPLVSAVKTLLSAWEHLEDNKEIVVFETVALLQNSFIVGDFDAFEKGDIENAIEDLTPTLDEVADFIRYKYPERKLIPKAWMLKNNVESKAQILGVLKSLTDREILRERNDQWSIVF